MKFLVFALVLGFSGFAFAHKGHHHYNPYTTSVYHDYKSVLGQISLHNACMHGEGIYSRANVKVCDNMVAKETSGNGEMAPSIDWTCQSYTMRPLSVSRNFTTSKCNKVRDGVGEAMPECVGWTTVPGQVPETIKVKIVTNHNGELSEVSKEGTFTFPKCTANELAAHAHGSK